MQKVDFKFSIGELVWIRDLQCWGRIISLWYTRSGNQYETRYFNNGEHKPTYLFEDELSEEKP